MIFINYNFFFRPVKKAKAGPNTPGTAKKKSENDCFDLCTLLLNVHVLSDFIGTTFIINTGTCLFNNVHLLHVAIFL